jgi:hypothetical protein
MQNLPPTSLRMPGSLPRAASALQARLGRKLAVSSVLALVTVLATAGLALAADPAGAVVEAPTTPDASEPILSVEVVEPSEASINVEVAPTLEASLSAEVAPTLEASLSAEVAPTLEASLSAEVAPTPEVNVAVEPAVPTPVPGGLPVEPVPPLDAVLAPVTEVVADQDPAGSLLDAEELVALPPLDPLSLPDTDAVTPTLIDAIEDAEDVVSSPIRPALQTLREAPEPAQPATAAHRPSFRSPAIDGWGVFAVGGDPAQRDSALSTPINPTSVIRLPAPAEGWYPGGVRAPGVVPRVAGGSGGSAGNSSTDPNPVAAVLAALAAAIAGWRILALRMPPNPTGIWLAAPVPPG